MPGVTHTFVVFSYNRGVYLRNCVSSIERLAPQSHVMLVDDCSDDQATREIVEQISQRHQLVTPADDPSANKHGGLYPNMQQAFDALPDNHLFTYLQEDMQLVRPWSALDSDRLQQFFESDENNGFLYNNFLKGHDEKRYRQILDYRDDSDTYVRNDAEGGRGLYYSDIFTSRTDRLRSVNWQFQRSEWANDAQAARCFNRMGFMASPISMFLPSVPAHRNRQRTWAMRKAESASRSGFYPIQSLSLSETDKFMQRDKSILPVAEQFLKTDPPAPTLPWEYGPFQSQRWFKRLHQLQTRLSSVVSRS